MSARDSERGDGLIETLLRIEAIIDHPGVDLSVAMWKIRETVSAAFLADPIAHSSYVERRLASADVVIKESRSGRRGGISRGRAATYAEIEINERLREALALAADRLQRLSGYVQPASLAFEAQTWSDEARADSRLASSEQVRS